MTKEQAFGLVRAMSTDNYSYGLLSASVGWNWSFGLDSKDKLKNFARFLREWANALEEWL